MFSERGFILTRSAYDSRGTANLCYYGRSESGPFKIIITSHRPLFFVERNIEIPNLPGMERRRVELATFSDKDVDALYFESLNSYYEGRRTLQNRKIQMFESDIRPADRYLMERFINGGVELSGQHEKSGNLTVWYNPGLKPSDCTPALKWISLDIETEPINKSEKQGLLYSIALHGIFRTNEVRQVFVLDQNREYSQQPPSRKVVWKQRPTGAYGAAKAKKRREIAQHHPVATPRGGDFSYSNISETEDIEDGVINYCKSEKELIISFLKFIKEWDPDILIGWHVIGFDLRFLIDKCSSLQIPFPLGRGIKKNIIVNERSGGMFSAEVEGRVVVDGPQTLRSSFYKFADFRLETVAMELLGRGKDITPDKDKLKEIIRRFNDDKPALARYNLEDSVLVTEIYKKTGLIEQLKTRSIITGLTIDRVNMSVAAFDHLMLPAVHRKGRVAFDTDDIISGGHAAGGHVFTSAPGLYHNVAVLDFKSLYPTIIRTFFIDPLSLNTALSVSVHGEQNTDDILTTPSGHRFSRSQHILPGFLTDMMKQREYAKEAKNTNLSQAIKILMNSFYGVMGTTGCRFYHPDLPSAITETGQWILKATSSFLKEKGYSVIYGDTDSVFITLKKDESADPVKAGNKLREVVNNYFSGKIKEDFGVESMLEMEFEKFYPKFFLPAMRSTREGARKRYAGYLEDGTIEFKGLEVVRSDWTPLAKKFQEELFERFFRDQELIEWIKNFIEELKRGNYNNLLIYKKKLSRKAEEYTKTTPPHIKAVRLEDPENKKNLKEIEYTVSLEGPRPVSMGIKDIDYTHYIEKQVKPLADGVLFAVNTNFDEIIEGRQLDLFS